MYHFKSAALNRGICATLIYLLPNSDLERVAPPFRPNVEFKLITKHKLSKKELKFSSP